MIDTIRRFFDKYIAPELEHPGEPHREHGYQLATAALLFEVSRADHRISDDELSAITALIKRCFDLSDTDTRRLMDLAREESEQAVSLYELTRHIDKRLSASEKIHIVELLWEVALADGALDRYEEYTIRKLADLLHVAHSDFIAAKLRVEKGMVRHPRRS
ncbi:MAG: TerB family tellurite resistance protein [Gammaproteobacteria bacterium]